MSASPVCFNTLLISLIAKGMSGKCSKLPRQITKSNVSSRKGRCRESECKSGNRSFSRCVLQIFNATFDTSTPTGSRERADALRSASPQPHPTSSNVCPVTKIGLSAFKIFSAGGLTNFLSRNESCFERSNIFECHSSYQWLIHSTPIVSFTLKEETLSWSTTRERCKSNHSEKPDPRH